MSYLIKMRNSKKKHLVQNLGDKYTVCGKKINSGEIMNCLPEGEEWNLCQKCYAWIGERMVNEWFGLDFIE